MDFLFDCGVISAGLLSFVLVMLHLHDVWLLVKFCTRLFLILSEISLFGVSACDSFSQMFTSCFQKIFVTKVFRK